ncbi:DUF4255 domain-containing protein [Streptomyces kronopolitis]|uniref:DUF4255 domain-containing protein n=1 Tax=Streptomyces kronopolitis TaxID=1612435 RepID=UPI0020C0ACD6|nr:DUF4255 domain-containing protein [Streptomyces kronopolitis]MCL6302594.1 DUF4255 domain-containing protein [Streptomyces kronopolitis]
MSVVHQVDDSLRAELQRGPLQAADIQVSFDTPDADWAARRAGPCVNLFLYGIEEDAARSQSGDVSIVDAQGTVVGYAGPPRYFRLTYLVSVWAQSVQDEHQLLGTLLEWCVRTEELMVHASSSLDGTGTSSRLALRLREAGDATEAVASRLWSSLGIAARPALDLAVTIPLSKPLEEVGPAPVEGMRLMARHMAGAGGDAGPGRPPHPEPPSTRRRRNVEEME